MGPSELEYEKNYCTQAWKIGDVYDHFCEYKCYVILILEIFLDVVCHSGPYDWFLNYQMELCVCVCCICSAWVCTGKTFLTLWV